jgi:alpha-L-fucosidase
MKKNLPGLALLFLLVIFLPEGCSKVNKQAETKSQSKMDWWNDARFGMFIHWGLYSIPAGEWNGETGHAEWIRTTAQIPLEVYDTLVKHFNPEKFNAQEWVRMAKDAGMKYIVITSKHHDGFCLFDSQYTDFDVMSTPFKRDILAEMAQACHDQGMVLCFYHSIMDWHNPDYLPRRDWEKTRSTEGADFERYITYMKNQLKELTTKYGAIGVLWFDGEWESTWNHTRGIDLYNYVINLQPGIIVNNRVDNLRNGMAGMSTSAEAKGDFGTPEQTVPATGIPGTYWESCITLNDHWGYNKADKNWKSSEEVIRMLTDIASKGGNLLLNIGPRSDGTFPDESVRILAETGAWMKKNGSSIYGTGSSPFANLPWGRCTSKENGKSTLLYLHVFNWPEDGMLVVPGITNKIKKVWLLDGGQKLKAVRSEADIYISLPFSCPDKINTVVVLEVTGKPVVFDAPVIEPVSGIFVGGIKAVVKDIPEDLIVRYTLDGTVPTETSPLYKLPLEITSETVMKGAYFLKGKRVGATAERKYSRVDPVSGTEAKNITKGLKYKYYEGNFNSMPDFTSLKPKSEGIIDKVAPIPLSIPEYFAQTLSGYLDVEVDGVYKFSLMSDDGSKLFVDGQLAVDNDGLHGSIMKTGTMPLAKGYHPVVIEFFQQSGGKVLELSVTGPEGEVDLKNALVH